MKELAPSRPEMPALAKSEVKFKEFVQKGLGLARMAALENVVVENNSLVFPRVPRAEVVATPYGSKTRRLFATQRPPSGRPTAVIFRDSFFTRLVRLVKEHFDRAVFVWSAEFDYQILAQEKPNIVIWERVERALMVDVPRSKAERSAMSLLEDWEEAVITSERSNDVRKAKVAVEGKNRIVLMMRPRSEARFGPIFLRDNAVLRFGYGVLKSAWEKPGDGVRFSITVERGSKGVEVFNRYLDPKNRKADRKWFSAELKLGAFAGSEIEVVLSTEAGPKGDRRADLAASSELDLTGLTIPDYGWSAL